MNNYQNCPQTRPIYSCRSQFFSVGLKILGGGGWMQLNVALSNMDNTVNDNTFDSLLFQAQSMQTISFLHLLIVYLLEKSNAIFWKNLS